MPFPFRLVQARLDFCELAIGERRMHEPAMQFLNLGKAAGADQDRGDLRLAQDPSDCQLGQTLATLPGQRCQFSDPSNYFLVNVFRF